MLNHPRRVVDAKRQESDEQGTCDQGIVEAVEFTLRQRSPEAVQAGAGIVLLSHISRQLLQRRDNHRTNKKSNVL
jgi:hypothetical protein